MPTTCGVHGVVRGVRRRRLVPRGLWQLSRRANDAGDERSICIASVAGLDALTKRHAWLPVQGDAEHVLEPCEPLQPRRGHRSPEQAHRLRFGI
jgi:hypothetical protein